MNPDNDILLMQCGEALENCISALTSLGAPETLCELVEARELLAHLNRKFGLKDGVFFSTLLEQLQEEDEALRVEGIRNE